MIKKNIMASLLCCMAISLQAEVEKEYFPDGTLKSEIDYKDGTRTATSKGVKNGIERIYYNNGQLAYEVHNIDNKRDGVLKWYEREGPLIKETHYKMGKMHGTDKIYFDNGKLQFSVNFVDDKKEGIEKEYYSTGQLASKVNYIHGKREGYLKRYHQKGYLMSQVLYKRNYKEGNEVFYDEKGKIIKKERNKMDRPIDVMKKIQTKKSDETLKAFQNLNFNPETQPMR